MNQKGIDLLRVVTQFIFQHKAYLAFVDLIIWERKIKYVQVRIGV